MNKYIKLLAGVVVAGTMWNCSDTDEPDPWLQSWPKITLEGSAEEYVEIGSDYTLPGFTAINTIDNSDASDRVKVQIYDNINGKYVSGVSTAQPGMYTVYYTSIASDVQTDPGMSTKRTIYVYNPKVTEDIKGNYKVDIDASYRYRTSNGQNMTFAEVAAANNNDVSNGINVSIKKIAPSIYQINDLLGGLVSQCYGYAASYPSLNFQDRAYLYLDPENKLTLLTATFGYASWSGNYNVTEMNDAEYNPETGSISYKAVINGFILTILLN